MSNINTACIELSEEGLSWTGQNYHMGSKCAEFAFPFVSERLSLPTRYSDIEKIGQGAMCIVLKATDGFLDRPVAIKYMKMELSDLRSLRRFQHEARVMSSFNHLHLPLVLDFGLSSCGKPYMVMELVEGMSLKELLSKGPLAPRLAIEIALKVLSAMKHCHEKGIVHRDLKANNIMIMSRQDDVPIVKVVDFGLASGNSCDRKEKFGITSKGSILGTPLYMSPEQVQGLSADPRSDIYSLGCVLFEMLTGTTPFSESTAVLTMSAHVKSKAPSIGTRISMDKEELAALDAVLVKMLQKSPADRQQSADQVIEELEKILFKLEGRSHELLKMLIKEIEQTEAKSHCEKAISKPASAMLFGEPGESAKYSDNDTTSSPLSSQTRKISIIRIIFACFFLAALTIVSSIGNDKPVFSNIFPGTAESDSGQPAKQQEARELETVKGYWNTTYGGKAQIANDRIYASPEFTDDDLGCLSKFPEARRLNLLATSVTGRGFDRLENTKIEMLDLRGLNITEQGFTHLAKMPRLNSIRLDRAPFMTDLKLSSLSKLEKLTYLNLSCTQLSLKSQIELATSKSLEVLILDGATGIDEKSLMILSRIPSLKKLSLMDQPKLSDSALQALAK
ncbi:MAG: protein kinase, partial [Candidatus Obscuribacterales bacterium]|nr:protein kinase [Candidatus Obscuribacterales bacterium]